MRKFLIFVITIVILSSSVAVHAQMSSSNYKIQWDTFSTGGDDTSGSASYQLRDSVAGNSIGSGTSASYETRAGYRAGVFDRVVTYEVFAQDDASETTATALSGNTVTVADTTGYAIGDFITIVQDQGASQVSGVGKVTSVNSGTGEITLDEITSDGVLSIDGTDDFVYELSATSLSLGTLSNTEVTTGVVGFNASVDVDSGFTVQVVEDGDLRDGGNTINDVTDGTVSAGSEEYGGFSSDGDVTFGTQDSAFTTDFQPVADRTGNSFEARDLLTVKAAISSSTPDGSYAHQLTFVVSGNY